MMLRLALTFLSTLFSFNDFPDFLLIACRGDLSDIAEPFVMGAWWVPFLRLYPRGGDSVEPCGIAPCAGV